MKGGKKVLSPTISKYENMKKGGIHSKTGTALKQMGFT